MSTNATEAERSAQLMQALGNQYGMLQSARGSTIAESSSRSSLYLTSLSGAVVGLSFVAQASRFGETFFIYARAMSKIQNFYSQIDPARAGLFSATTLDQVGLARLGLFRLRWQQFLSSAATIAIVNAVVGGVFVAVAVAFTFGAPAPVAVLVGALAAAAVSAAFLRHQWVTWMHVAQAVDKD